jgi:hypothetical protein
LTKTPIAWISSSWLAVTKGTAMGDEMRMTLESLLGEAEEKIVSPG